MSWPEPTRADHERFCRIEGWARVRDARGRTGTHHLTFELALPDGRILRTRVSHPPDRTSCAGLPDAGGGPSLWRHVLRDQLAVTEAEFWACVRDGRPPGRTAAQAPAGALPAEVVHLLLAKVGLAESEVAAMSREQAVARLGRYWTEGA